MNEVLPYVSNKDKFISIIKHSMKDHLCKHFALDCWINDFMACNDTDRILSDEGYEIFKKKYENEINAIMEDISKKIAAKANVPCNNAMSLN